jgi:hypothetical protein
MPAYCEPYYPCCAWDDCVMPATHTVFTAAHHEAGLFCHEHAALKVQALDVADAAWAALLMRRERSRVMSPENHQRSKEYYHG